MPEIDTQPQFPIRTVAARTGLSAHVLRAWERRYEAVEPTRAEGGGRLYSSADIARFRLLHRLTREGHAIGQIARLSTPELQALLREDAAEETRPPAEPRDDGAVARVVSRALAAVEEMDGHELRATLMRAAVALPSDVFRGGVVVPLLHRVGSLWETRRMCPAHEHVLSAEVGRVLGWLAGALEVGPDAPEALAATPAGHRHEFGALLAAGVAAEEGWRVTYLGPDLPAEDVARAAAVRRTRLILLSVTLATDGGALADDLRALRAAVGDATSILVGGRGAAREAVESAGAVWIPDFDALRAALRALRPEAAR